MEGFVNLSLEEGFQVQIYLLTPKYPKQTADPDQTLQNAASDQGVHCLPIMQQFF